MNVRTNRRRAAGFTLIELSVVMLIIGLMVTFLLVASYQGVERANERATQALILKLDTALADRVDALASLTPPVTTAHRDLAQVDVPAGGPLLESDERALVIARLDFLRAELPDVFFVQDDANYPLNFCGQPYNPNGSALSYAHYTLPLGVGLIAPPLGTEPGALIGTRIPANRTPHNWIDGQPLPPALAAGRGIFGAHYGIAAGLYKQLGYAPQGCNGLDDDNDNLIDERDEGDFGLTPQQITDINLRLLNHKHETARSEMLYAILVEGQGPLGSFFQIEDFRPGEVGDTDQDGLMEFLDAWGKPLQFFRWPIYLVSDVGGSSFQVGMSPYGGLTASRDQNSLDPNQTLMTPSWWTDLAAITGPQTSAMMSGRARVVHQHFIGLVDPLADSGAANGGQYWDRNGFYKRRAFNSKFLIASGGPDLRLGVGLFGVDYSDLGTPASPYWVNVDEAIPVVASRRDAASFQLTAIEGQAGRTDPVFRTSADPSAAPPFALGSTTGANAGAAGLYQGYTTGPPNPVDIGLNTSWATDDITNHTNGSAGTGVR